MVFLDNRALAQQDLETIKYRNIVIDLDNGLKTNAQLTIPAVGNGPFPGVLLIPGSGNVDMNETVGYIRIDNETGAKIVLHPTEPGPTCYNSHLLNHISECNTMDSRSIA